MLAKFWETFSGKLAESWLPVLLGLAPVFWTGGVAVLLLGLDANADEIDTWFDARASAEIVVLLLGAAFLVAGSALLVRRFALPALRLLQGYWAWLPGKIRDLAVGLQTRRLNECEEELEPLNQRRDELAKRAPPESLDPSESQRRSDLEVALRRAPAQAAARMPTRLGNVLRAAEERVRAKYGLDPVASWPHLWILIPTEDREQLSEARRALNAPIEAWVWSLGFTLWTIGAIWSHWAWLALPIGLAGALLFYRAALPSAVAYAELFEATFDVRRGLLYDALRWPKPKTPLEERPVGTQMSIYLWRGWDEATPEFVDGGEANDGAGEDSPEDAPKERLALLTGIAIGGTLASFVDHVLRKR